MNKRTLGSEFEDIAAAYLRSRGHEILARNFRCRLGEIDLISRDGETLVFTEVKYRFGMTYGQGEFHVTRQKQQTIARVAEYYLMKNCPGLLPLCRFDVVAIRGDGSVRHIENAFEK